MPSFDITSEVDMPSLKNAVDVANRKITNRYDFKGSDAHAELNEKDKTITLFADNDFQLRPDAGHSVAGNDQQKH